MRNFLRRTLFITLSVILAPNASAVAGGLTVELKPHTQHADLMQPVNLELQISNTGALEVIVFDPEFGPHIRDGIEFHIKHPEAENYSKIDFPYIYTGAMKLMSPPKHASVLSIAPDSKYNAGFQLHYNFYSEPRHQWLFPNPGTYKIKALVYAVKDPRIKEPVPYHAEKEPLYSNEVEVVVNEAKSGNDKKMLDDFINIKHVYRLYQTEPFDHGLQSHTETYFDAKKFLEKYSSGRLARLSKAYVETEDKAIERYKARMEAAGKYREEQERLREERQQKAKEMYESLTEQQKKAWDLTAAEMKRITDRQKREQEKSPDGAENETGTGMQD